MNQQLLEGHCQVVGLRTLGCDVEALLSPCLGDRARELLLLRWLDWACYAWLVSDPRIPS